MDPKSLSLKMSVPTMKDFVLTDKLGSGTYATVYKAYRKVQIYYYERILSPLPKVEGVYD